MLQRFESFVTGIHACYKYIQHIKVMEMTEFGLKGTHAMCLFFLYHKEEGVTAAQLSQLCGEDKAAISRSLSALRQKGLLAVGEKKYRARLHLTEAGKSMARQVDRVISQYVCSGGDGLTEQERTVFYRALDKIAANLKTTVEHVPV